MHKGFEKTIFIVRHGQTDYNALNIVQGKGINSSLNEKGLKQAEAFFQFHFPQAFDVIYTSQLQRTHQTVNAFIQSGIKHKIHPGFDEIDWGNLEGKVPVGDVLNTFNFTVNCWKNGDLDLKAANGESPNELAKRQKFALENLLLEKNEKKVLICTHGRAMRCLLCVLLNLPLTQMDQFQHNNTHLYVLGYKNKQFELLVKNNAHHLHA